MNIEMKKVSELVPYERNPRNNENAVAAVAASIKEFGFKVPIVVDKDNVIVAGHTRLAAAQQLGLQEVPVIVADDLTPAQIKAFRLADNKTAELADWDFELLDNELAEIAFDMTQFGFEDEDFDWADVTDISRENYEEPDHTKLRCPVCGAVDYKVHFKKVDNEEAESEE